MKTIARRPTPGAGSLPFLALALLLSAAPLRAQLTYPGCAELRPTDFRQVFLASNAVDNTLREPLKMAFATDAQGSVDVYFTQRRGKVRKYSTARNALLTVADFAYTTSQVPLDRNSFGLIGIAVDPGFRTNRWIYLYIGMARDWRIARFTVNGDVVNLASERVIFRFDPGATASNTHVAGTIRFDADGMLWATVADNENPHQSANTNSYLGKIIRILPRAFPDAGAAPAPGAGRTYDIPAGNLYPAGTARTLPEVYVMGVRNPYTLVHDPARRAVAWGDVGPDVTQVGTGTEEFNYTTSPGNFGYPFWAGNQYALEAGHGTPAAPINDLADNTGLRELRPAIAATIPYRKACAITGPFYRYNGALRTPYRLPPHLNGKWLVSDFNLSWIDAVTLDNAGRVQSRAGILSATGSDDFDNPVELDIGPDGALYAMNYSGYRTWGPKTGLMRIEYRGGCLPAAVGPTVAGRKAGFRLEGPRLTLEEKGPHAVAVRDPDGRLVRSWNGDGPRDYDLRTLAGTGLRFLEITTVSGSFRKSLIAAP